MLTACIKRPPYARSASSSSSGTASPSPASAANSPPGTPNLGGAPPAAVRASASVSIVPAHVARLAEEQRRARYVPGSDTPLSPQRTTSASDASVLAPSPLGHHAAVTAESYEPEHVSVSVNGQALPLSAAPHKTRAGDEAHGPRADLISTLQSKQRAWEALIHGSFV
ncbi:hypothetical protein EIP86_000036 [Pleurotus ostreatoroseus]|nr:hypothetical protein EIP86_000036 [Pleurotus ostreatoroseus]